MFLALIFIIPRGELVM